MFLDYLCYYHFVVLSGITKYTNTWSLSLHLVVADTEPPDSPLPDDGEQFALSFASH
jgi:hypothetical protein